jgi:hypothetical protein
MLAAIRQRGSPLALAAVLPAYISPLLLFGHDHYWKYLWMPPVGFHGIILVPLAFAGTLVAVRGLLRDRRAGEPGDDLWYVAAALLGLPYLLMLLLYGFILLLFLFGCLNPGCDWVL